MFSYQPNKDYDDQGDYNILINQKQKSIFNDHAVKIHKQKISSDEVYESSKIQ